MQEALEEAGRVAGIKGSVGRTPVVWLAIASCLLTSGALLRADDSPTSPAVIRELRSRHIHLRTDVDPAEARVRLRRMEHVLALASKYWGRALPGIIDAYLVEHPDRWRSEDFPLRQARVVLEQISGGTALDYPSSGRNLKPQTCVYATTAAGVAEHEMVHAYCFQTFGRGGPDWYREGMAEVFASLANGDSSICRAETRRLLQDVDAISLKQIVARKDFTRDLYRSVQRLVSLPDEATARVAFDPSPWTQADQQTLNQVRRAYAESWALCHLLCGNPNYHSNFRLLGRRLLAGQPVRFEDALRPIASEIDFELNRLVKHLADGYRVDLCRWPWEAGFSGLDINGSVSVRVSARAGFQATHVLVAPDQKYHVRTAGRWFLRTAGEPLDGDGDASGWGNLEAAILDGFCLDSTADLGRAGGFAPQKTGRLYLRCQDRWNELADNHGQLLVRLTRIR